MMAIRTDARKDGQIDGLLINFRTKLIYTFFSEENIMTQMDYFNIKRDMHTSAKLSSCSSRLLRRRASCHKTRSYWVI